MSTMCLSKIFSAVRVALRESKAGHLALPQKPLVQFRAPARGMFGLVPRNQYENNSLPKKFQLSHAIFHYWETIPLFICVVIDVVVVVGYMGLYNAFVHKVDTQLTKHNWNCISRNMDLREPTVHKNFVLYQRYEPWPEMQDVLDKMTQAERRNQLRLDTCGKLPS